MDLVLEAQDVPHTQSDTLSNPFGLLSKRSLPTASPNAFKLPGLQGIACQGRWQALQAHEFARHHKLTHFYVDGSKGIFTSEVENALFGLVLREPQQPIYHSNYHQPIASPDAKLRLAAKEALKEEIAIAARFHAPLILHGTSGLALHRDIPDHREALMAFDAELFELRAYANQAGVELWIETMPINEAAVFTCMADFEYILNRHSDVKVVLDVGHTNILNNSPFEALSRFPDKIAAISLSDNNGRVDLHQPLGKGSIRFEEMFQAIENSNWQGIYVFETMGSHIADDLAVLYSILSR